MASTSKQLLQKISKGHLECQICMDRIRQPKMLECSHSFCLECLRQLAQKLRITCPVCRGQTSLTGKGVSGLRTDFKMASLLDEIKQHETELQSQQKLQTGQGYISKCTDHTDKDFILFCDTCDKLICITCIGEVHRMHKLAELSLILKRLKQKATEIFAVVEQHEINFNIATQNIVESQKNLDSMFADTKAKISKKADEEIAKETARIRKEEQKLMDKLDKIHEDRAEYMENAKAANNKEMTTAQNTKDEVTLLMDGGSSCENLLLIKKLLQDIMKYTEMQPAKLPHGLSYMDFQFNSIQFNSF
ncbi:tripartite motif-containing protein 3-like [Asterias rubens]|uniref:tripartite motif-containing protein 3-like n=1 Tax=Asterias rubens TaxID=7604 RepID=UPI0014558F48|nr:tripartite motif-containing protein 3-like [Asterias rubens]